MKPKRGTMVHILAVRIYKYPFTINVPTSKGAEVDETRRVSDLSYMNQKGAYAEVAVSLTPTGMFGPATEETKNKLRWRSTVNARDC